MIINIAIVDDENEFSSNLEKSLIEYFEEGSEEKKINYHIDVYSSAILFLEKCSHYNIVFMDIDLPIINGLQASKEFREKNENAILIYCTNYARFAVDGYQYQAIDYLVKPIHKQHLRMTMDKVVKSIYSLEKASIAINVEKGKRIIKQDEILYVEVKRKLLYYHINGQATLSERKSLKEAYESLDKNKFARCNHCYLVNLDYVKEFYDDYLVLTSGDTLSVSRNRKKEFQEQLTVFLGSHV